MADSLLSRLSRRRRRATTTATTAQRRRPASSSSSSSSRIVEAPPAAVFAIFAAVFVVACVSSFGGGLRNRSSTSADVGVGAGVGVGTLPPRSLRAVHGERGNQARGVRAEVPGAGGIPTTEAGDPPPGPGGATTATVLRRRHAIPPILIFTYRTDLINAPPPPPSSDPADDGGEDDAALSENVRSVISLHPGASVRFLDDAGCLDSIRAALGPGTKLAAYFSAEGRGMYKADICRGAALYETGGLYFDVDIEARMSLFDVVDVGTEFVTTLVHEDSNHRGGFFQAFIGSTGGHPILRRYLELFVDYYEGRVDVRGPLGVYLLRMAYDDVVGGGGKKGGEGGYAATVELWQEVRYRPDLFPEVTRDRWGSRRACQMLVVAPPRPPGRAGRAVPLFSHANGSRMCGGKDTDKKG